MKDLKDITRLQDDTKLVLQIHSPTKMSKLHSITKEQLQKIKQILGESK